ncbi:MAG: low molecular weight phosphotyrosine protein phosphatase [Chitinophagaceae bacterium]|nr:low molecular weight phosphotyrosine protein phosphatase [Chitinophagaceae bacterium]
MVCLGNICRSPMAEGILKKLVKQYNLNWEVASAGTNDYHRGEPPHPLARKVCHIHGINIDSIRKRKFCATDFKEYDRIYAMATDVLEEMRYIAGKDFDARKAGLLMDELYPGRRISVPDPWYGPEDAFHQAYKMIENACKALVEKYAVTCCS